MEESVIHLPRVHDVEDVGDLLMIQLRLFRLEDFAKLEGHQLDELYIRRAERARLAEAVEAAGVSLAMLEQ